MNLKDSNINDKENDTGVGMRQNNLCESTEDKEDRKRVKSRTRAPEHNIIVCYCCCCTRNNPYAGRENEKSFCSGGEEIYFTEGSVESSISSFISYHHIFLV